MFFDYFQGTEHYRLKLLQLPELLNKNKMAERVGFEPTEPAKAQQFSRLPDSTTLAPLRDLSQKAKMKARF
jgi:hypothetical protein